jgi:DNA-directed RNA polymerase subunit beta
MRTPQETFEAMKQEIAAGLTAAFPVTSGKRTLELHDVQFDPMPGHDDWNGQKEASLTNKTWGAPVRGTFSLKDEHGKTIEKKSVRLGLLPTPTNRHTFIVDGREYQVSNQRRLGPGLYTKVNRLGQALADFQVKHGRNFSVGLDPASNQFYMKYANTHIPLTAVMQGLWHDGPAVGKAFEHEHTPQEVDDALHTLWAETQREPAPTKPDELKMKLRDYFNKTTMDPAVNQMTVGHGHPTVNVQALQDAAKHVLEIHRGERMPSGRDDLGFADIHGVEDFLRERLEGGKGLIAAKLRQKLDRADGLGGLNLQGAIAPQLHNFFTTSEMSNNPIQVNPLEMKENAFKLTSMGKGGIGDSNAIPAEVRAIHPSQSGFIDPVRTPDNAKAGVDVRATLGAKKVGKRMQAPMVNVKTGKTEMLTPQQLYDKFVAHDKETPINGLVRAIHRGQIVDVDPKQVDYHIPTEQAWTVSTALVPFLPNSHAHRAAMGAKMLGQALSLAERERPIVDTLHSDEAIQGLLPVAPVAGTVHRITPGVVTIKDAQGALHPVHYAHEFPLNGGSYLDTKLHFQVGDTVKKGTVLGDNNFTQAGSLALGKNLHVAMLPLEGHNYEDGIAVTETGAKKLTSLHLHTEEVEADERTVNDLTRFRAHFPGKFEVSHLAKLDDKGVVKVGQTLKEGDPIFAMLRKRVTNPESLILGKAHKSLMEPYRDASVVWEKPYEGKVTAVAKTPKGFKVTIAAAAPAQIGDKLAGRFGNKGVITTIIPDHEAPRTVDGKIPDVFLNTAGLPSRMNPAQIYEMAAGKALQAMGKATEKFPQFLGVNSHTFVKKLVAKAGVTERDTFIDPKTGLKLHDPVLNGPMYMLKLFKQADTGYSARSGGAYDIDLRPAKGGEEGAKSVGTLDLAGLLAHGATSFLREAATYKAEYNPEVFAHMWRGLPLPPPKPTFAYNKFLTMVQGMGLNVKKDGSKLMLLPMRDADTLAISSGPVTKPLTVMDKEDPHTNLPFRPEEGGLFDPTTTGGLVGNRWSHITLAEPVVNPLFHQPVRTILGMNKQEFKEALAAEGGAGIAKRLGTVNPGARIQALKQELKTTNATARRDDIYKQLRYLTALDKNGLRPDDAYVMKHVPVVPPTIRPIYPDADTGQVTVSDANRLYQNLMLVSDQLAAHAKDGDPETVKALRVGLHDAVAKVQGLDGNAEAIVKAGEREPKGFLQIITGGRAKEGFFQSKLMTRRQDVAGRGVVVPDPSLGIDDIGIPEAQAWKLYRNHAVGELVKSGMPLTAAAEAVESRNATARTALDLAMKNAPLILSRAPSLHKFNLQAFKPQVVGGKSIRVNNLIHKGFNMDHDGDACNLHVPLGPEAIADAFRMMPSNNLYNPLNRNPVHQPTNETTMGLWKVTNVGASKPTRHFASQAEAVAAFKRGDIRIDEPIEITGL